MSISFLAAFRGPIVKSNSVYLQRIDISPLQRATILTMFDHCWPWCRNMRILKWDEPKMKDVITWNHWSYYSEELLTYSVNVFYFNLLQHIEEALVVGNIWLWWCSWYERIVMTSANFTRVRAQNDKSDLSDHPTAPFTENDHIPP